MDVTCSIRRLADQVKYRFLLGRSRAASNIDCSDIGTSIKVAERCSNVQSVTFNRRSLSYANVEMCDDPCEKPETDVLTAPVHNRNLSMSDELFKITPFLESSTNPGVIHQQVYSSTNGGRMAVSTEQILACRTFDNTPGRIRRHLMENSRAKPQVTRSKHDSIKLNDQSPIHCHENRQTHRPYNQCFRPINSTHQRSRSDLPTTFAPCLDHFESDQTTSNSSSHPTLFDKNDSQSQSHSSKKSNRYISNQTMTSSIHDPATHRPRSSDRYKYLNTSKQGKLNSSKSSIDLKVIQNDDSSQSRVTRSPCQIAKHCRYVQDNGLSNSSLYCTSPICPDVEITVPPPAIPARTSSLHTCPGSRIRMKTSSRLQLASQTSLPASVLTQVQLVNVPCSVVNDRDNIDTNNRNQSVRNVNRRRRQECYVNLDKPTSRSSQRHTADSQQAPSVSNICSQQSTSITGPIAIRPYPHRRRQQPYSPIAETSTEKESVVKIGKTSTSTRQLEEKSPSDHASRILERLSDNLRRGKLTDVVLVAGESSKHDTTELIHIPAHRAILAAASDYFAAMFGNGLRESSENEVWIRQINPDALGKLVDYIYNGHLVLTEDNVQDLLDASCFLQIPEASLRCQQFLTKRLNVSNCLSIRRLAKRHDCRLLDEAATRFSLENFTDLIRTEDYNSLELDELIELIKSDQIRVVSEAIVFTACLHWARSQHRSISKASQNGSLAGDEERHRLDNKPCSSLVRLLQFVRLRHVPVRILTESLKSEPLVYQDSDAVQLLATGLHLHLNPSRIANKVATTPQLQVSLHSPRPSTIGKLLAIGGTTLTSSKGLQDILEYDPYNQIWSKIGQLPGQRQQCGCLVLPDGRLLIIGGRDELKTLSTVECIYVDHLVGRDSWNRRTGPDNSDLPVSLLASGAMDLDAPAGGSVVTDVNRIVAKDWQVVSAMATHRHGLGVALLEQVVYAVGGHDGWSYLNTVERWDGQAKSWSSVAPIAVQRSALGVAVLDGQLYAIGGRDGNSCLRTVERFNPHTQHWSFVAPMLHRRAGVGVAASNGRLFAVGGYNVPPNHSRITRTSSVEMYDALTDMWSEVCDSPLECDSIGVAVLGSELYIIGGHDGHQHTSDVYAYKIQSDEWRKDWNAVVKIVKANTHPQTNFHEIKTIKLQQNVGETLSTITYSVQFGFIELPLDHELGSGKRQVPESAIVQIIGVVLYEPLLPDDVTVESKQSVSFTYLTGIKSSTEPIPVSDVDLANAKSNSGVIAKELSSLEVALHSELSTALARSESDLRRLHTLIWNRAALLSMGPFQTSKDYLSFSPQPSQLIRDFQFRRLHITHSRRHQSFVNVRIRIVPGRVSITTPHLMDVRLSVERVGLDDSRDIDSQFVSLTSTVRESVSLLHQLEREASDSTVYACPAGCETEPVQVGSNTEIPFLVTNPFSHILYIGIVDGQQMKERIQQKKYGSAKSGPHPNHDLIMLHRHGHALGGLPWLFWFMIGLPIGLLHFFLCKLIYDEMRKTDFEWDTSSSSRWRLPQHFNELRGGSSMNTQRLINAELTSRRRFANDSSNYFPTL